MGRGVFIGLHPEGAGGRRKQYELNKGKGLVLFSHNTGLKTLKRTSGDGALLVWLLELWTMKAHIK